jgi:hypothetical protein
MMRNFLGGLALALALVPPAFAQQNPNPSYPDSVSSDYVQSNRVFRQPDIGVAGGVVGVGTGIAPDYLGEVATRAAVAEINNSGDAYAMARSMHVARKQLSELSVGFGGFYAQAGVEHNNGAATTVTASVEYSGNFYPLLFNGKPQGIIQPGAVLQSDMLHVNIPNGAVFYVRQHLYNPSGIYFTAFDAITPGTPQGAKDLVGDAVHYGATLAGVPDQTGGGTVTATDHLNYIYPVDIVAPTNLTSVCIWGDSRAVGIFDKANDATGEGGVIQRYVGQRYAYISLASQASTLNTTVTNDNIRVGLSQYCNIGIDQLGVNDLSGGQTPTQMVANRTTLEQQMPGLVWYGTTIEPEDSSTDNFVTLANETPAAWDSNRLTFNQDVEAGVGLEVNYIDIAGMIDPAGISKWPVVASTPNACTPDGIHEYNVAAMLVNQGTECGTYINPFRNIDFSRH